MFKAADLLVSHHLLLRGSVACGVGRWLVRSGAVHIRGSAVHRKHGNSDAVRSVWTLPMDPMDCVIPATSVPFFSGSMMIIHCVAGPALPLPPN